MKARLVRAITGLIPSRIKAKILLLNFLVVIIPMILLAQFILYRSQELHINSHLHYLDQMVKQQSDFLEIEFDLYKEQAAHLSVQEELVSYFKSREKFSGGTIDRLKLVLEETALKHPEITKLTLLSNSGVGVLHIDLQNVEEVHLEEVKMDLAYESVVQEAMQSGKQTLFVSLSDATSLDKITSNILRKVVNKDGDILAMILLEVQVGEILKRALYIDNIPSFITDDKNRLIAQSRNMDVPSHIVERIKQSSFEAELELEKTENTLGQQHYNEDDYYSTWEKVFYDSSNVKKFLVIHAVFPIKALIAPYSRLMLTIILIIFAATAFISAAILLISDKISNQTIALLKVMKEVGIGTRKSNTESENSTIKEIQQFSKDMGIPGTAVEDLYMELEKVVTERTIELNASNQRFELATQASQDGIWDYDGRVNSLYVSDLFTKMTGYIPGDMTEGLDSISSIIHPMDRERVMNAVDDHLNNKGQLNAEFRLKCKKMGYKWVHVSAISLWDESGTLLRTVGSLRDISKAKNYEKKLEAEAHETKKFLQVVEASADAILITDKDRNIVYVNAAWEQLTGYTALEAKGKNPRILKSNKTPEVVYEKMRKAWTEVHSFRTTELVNKRKDGTEYNAELLLFPVLDFEKKVLFYASSQRDITSEIQEDQAKKEFISLASHQLRTPLTAIKWIIETLMSAKVGSVTKEQEDLLLDAKHVAANMDQTISTMLMLSRIDSGKIKFKKVDTKICTIIDELIAEQKTALTSKQDIVHLRCSKPNTVHTDPDLIREVLRNIINNAIKYSGNDGKVEVSVRYTAKNAIIAVSDTGVGIPASELDKLFTKFYRGSNVVGKITEGTGLGLYLVQSILDLLHGTIECETQENVGTTFTITLPL